MKTTLQTPGGHKAVIRTVTSPKLLIKERFEVTIHANGCKHIFNVTSMEKAKEKIEQF